MCIRDRFGSGVYFGSRENELYLVDSDFEGDWRNSINPLVTAPTEDTTRSPLGVTAAAFVGARLIIGGNARCWYDTPENRLGFGQTSSSGSFEVGVDGDKVTKIIELPQSGSVLQS